MAKTRLDLSLPELLKGSQINLAVTGLSRAGKTVFITSLVHNVLSALHQPHRMPLLKAVADGRLVAARVSDDKPRYGARFPYEQNIVQMAANPANWPPRTADVSEITIEIRFIPTGILGFLLGRLGKGVATLKLTIIDYPGEWLLDLPLLTQSYTDWSRSMLQLCRRGIRATTGRDFLEYLAEHPHNEVANQDHARKAHELYRDYLRISRDRHGLSFLQPGRFIDPGVHAQNAYLEFAPLNIPDDVRRIPDGTLAALMEKRFEAYKSDVVMPFYRNHFRNYSRQLVLVDVLGSLLGGQEVFEDTRRGIEAILGSFRYGQSGIIRQLVGSARVEKVLFAATKADHVPDVQRDHLASLLRNMVALPAIEVSSSNARIEVAALASVISTQDDSRVIEGQRVQVVVGRPVGSDKRASFFVGNVPARPPRPETWGAPFLNIPVFEPPIIDPSPIEGVPHMNLDVALEYLIGDQLR